MAFRLDPSKDKWLEANKLVRIAPAMPSKTDHDGTEQYQVTLREAGVPVQITWYNALGNANLNHLLLLGVRQGRAWKKITC
jgi:hypothetical protein